MEKKRQDPCEYSKDEFMVNRPASVNDCTGYSQRAYIDASEAESLADLMDVTAKEEKSEIR